MAFPEKLQKLIDEANWAIYVCSNPECKNTKGDPSYEESTGLSPEVAPPTIKCLVCGSDMKKVN